MKQPLGQRRRHQCADAGGTGRLAEDGDAAGIATEGRDVGLNPAQRRDLIEMAVVAGRPIGLLGAQIRMRQEAEAAEPVVHRDDHDAVARQPVPLEDRQGSRSHQECAAVEPDHHRTLLVARRRGRPDVQIEAVLAFRLWAEIADRGLGTIGLNAARPERHRRPRAAPRLRRLRRPPAQCSERRARIGHAFEGANCTIVAPAAGEQPTLDAHDVAVRLHATSRSDRL